VQICGVFAKTQETGTGMCAVLVNGKERTLCANIGASAKYPTQHLLDNIVRIQTIIKILGLFLSSTDNLLIGIFYHFE